MMQIKKIMKNRFGNNRGFTLIEAIAVLVIMSIIAAVVISRGDSSATATIKSSAEALKGHIRFAQMRALNSDAPDCAASVGMTVSGSSYSMFRITGSTGCGTTENVVLPGAQNSSGVTLPSGMTVSATPSTFSFDRWGRPHPDAIGTAASVDIPLTVSYAGMSESVTITRNTGYVP
jgi:prepilin-type N-terminal cleavage/methylation domain-containing protein